MLQLIYSPQWFYGKDIVIDIVSIIVLALVAFFSLRFYKINKNKNYFYLALSFILLGIAFIFKIMMNFSIYYHVIETKDMGIMTLTYHTIEVTNTLFLVGSFLYMFLTIIGFYMLYSTYQSKPQSKLTHLLILYFITIVVYFSRSAYTIFHLTLIAILILILIVYALKHLSKKRISTVFFAASLAMITVSQILFILIAFNSEFYVAAEIVQLIGYTGILATLISVLKHGGKKN